MAVLDFLFEGKPPAATTTYGSSTSTMPAWYNDYTQGLISKANAIAAQGYQPYVDSSGKGIPRVASATGAQEQAWNDVGGLKNTFNANFNPAIQTMQGMQGFTRDPNTGNLVQGTAPSALGQIGGPNGINPLDQFRTAAGIRPDVDPFNNFGNARTEISGGAGSALNGIGSYLNDPNGGFTKNVVDEIGRLGQENLDNTMSGIADKYISGGQFGGSRMGRSMGNAMRAGARDIAGLQSQALERGYGQALGASQADLARKLQAGSQYGQLGSTQGGLASQTQQNLANLGQSLGTFGQADLQRQMEAAKGQGALAQTANEQAIRNAAALESAGTTQQGQQQRLLDTAYQDFVANRDHPQQMASFMNNMIRGLQVPVSQQTTQTGPASSYQASPLAQIAAAGTGVAGLSKLFGGT